jgi:hypothetical protein
MWWGLYSLKQTLAIVTGYPSMIMDPCCSVPLPIPVPEEQILDGMEAAYGMCNGSASSTFMNQGWSDDVIEHPCTPVGLETMEANSGSFLKATAQLSIITQSILTSLYSAAYMAKSAGEVQKSMAQLEQCLDGWVLSLPMEFNFQGPVNGASMTFARERMLLGFQCCSARMLLARPCFDVQRQAWREGNEASLARRIGNSCIEAAKTVVNFLPDEPSSPFIYDQGPWWCIVHHMMQAVSVFLFSFSYPSSTSQDSILLIHYVKKVLRWLRAMHDPVAERAYYVTMSSFESALKRYPVDVSHIWRMDAVQGREVRQNLDTDMTADPHTRLVQLAVPGNTAMATYAAYDAGTTGVMFSAYDGTSRSSEFRHMRE